jgi:signal transduction histidine kinase
LPLRPKLFLTFAVLCMSPLLILSLISFRNGLVNADDLLQQGLELERSEVAHHYFTLVHERERELTAIAKGPLRDFVRDAKTPEAVALIESAPPADSAAGNSAAAVREAITNLPAYYANLACFAPDKHQMFLNQPGGSHSQSFRTKDFLPGFIEPDENVWGSEPGSGPRCNVMSQPEFGRVLRCSVPIFLTPKPDNLSARGVLVADLKLAELFAETDRRGGSETTNRRVIVLDSAGKIIYHENAALRNQPVNSSLPELTEIAASMTPGLEGYAGFGNYRTPEGNTWTVATKAIDSDLFLIVARNYSAATLPARRTGWLGIVLAILFGLAGATFLTLFYDRRTKSLEQVKRTVAAIAKGKLDQQLLLRSSDDLRPIADNVNLMTERLRAQLAREAEAQQFQSFAKLSAFLTHDLKNAIEGLSLMVGNMERHFDNPKFRADAMRALTAAADKLRGLVTQLSNPVSTLSGEFKMPRPTDLVPLLQRVREQIAEPLRSTHEIETHLPQSLMAMADGERIEKVIENLVLNAVEAMRGKPGKLTIAADQASSGKVYFSVADTGVGMSAEFIQQRLFHPFATTKMRGVGLGLYTCREVVRANGGSIEVKSKEGSGTTFRVVLASAPIKEHE